MNLDLRDKNALVCGSTQGIGKAAALQLAQMGAGLTLMARNENALQDTLREIGGDHDYIVADFSQPEQVREAIQAYLARTGKTFHILINNTGGPPGGPIIDATAEAFLSAWHMHLTCSHYLAQALVPGMKAAAYGRIINVISTSVKIPINGLGVSNTTRAAMAGWSKTLANELGHLGITVNNVLPGFTETARLHAVIRSRATLTGMSEEAVAQEMRSSIPAGRFGHAEETASAIAFLASPAAAYINGVNLPVDGGRTGSF